MTSKTIIVSKANLGEIIQGLKQVAERLEVLANGGKAR